MSTKWTFMVYMAGSNTLSAFAGRDLTKLRKVGSGEELKVTVFVKRLEQQAEHRMVIGKDGKNERREDLGGAVNSGSPQTLVDFIRWSKAEAPAERYALLISAHGPNWSSAAGAPRELDTIELGNVLKEAHEVLGHPVDLLGMDVSLMSSLEVAYQAGKDVRAVVCSEQLEPGDGWPYEKILADLRSNPMLDGAGLGRVVVRRYVESYKHAEARWPVTMCAIHTAGIEPFADALDALTMALRRAIKDDDADATRLLRAHTRSARFDGDLVDLRTLCVQVRAQSFEGAVKGAAKRVLDALKPGGDFVVANANLGETVEHCGGVTAYLPAPTDEISPGYKDLRFAQRHGWDEFVRAYQRAVRGG